MVQDVIEHAAVVGAVLDADGFAAPGPDAAGQTFPNRVGRCLLGAGAELHRPLTPIRQFNQHVHMGSPNRYRQHSPPSLATLQEYRAPYRLTNILRDYDRGATSLAMPII